jgi:hypothetical protein
VRRILATYIKLPAYKISAEAGVKLPKIDWKHEAVATWALIGTLITLIGLMPLLMRSTGKW